MEGHTGRGMERGGRQGFCRRHGRFGCGPAAAGRMMMACAMALFFAGAAVGPLGAQTYPNKPVHFILPFPPGGATDILGRIMGQMFAERLGQPFNPEHRPGSGVNIGSDAVAKAKPDGYTVLLAGPALTISPALYRKLTYDPVKDLAPIAKVLEGHYVLLVRPSLPVKTLKELVEYAKARPGKLNFGSGGIGTPNHMASELFNYLAKLKIVHVPYKGVNQAMMGMMGNEIDMVVIGTPAALPQIKAGKVRPLAVLSEERVPSIPDVPTSKEAGVENFEVMSWYGLLVPAGTPGEIIGRLNSEWARLAALPETKEKMLKVEFEPVSGSPEKFARFIRAEVAQWSKVVKAANLSVD